MTITFWYLITIGLFLLMFILVPLNKIMSYLSFGIYFGFLLALLVMFSGVTLFKLWQIKNPAIDIAGFDLTLALDWFPLAIIFCHFIKKFSSNWYSLSLYIGFFAVMATIGQGILTYYGYWENIRWNSFATFALGILAHLLMSGYLILRGNIPKPSKII